jgi:cyclophilin family peptidyl-prolyl cis-trans isomerase
MREVKASAEQQRLRRRKTLRRVLSAIVVAGIVVLVVALVSSKGPAKKSAATKTTTTTLAPTSTTTPSVAAVAPVCPPASGATKRETEFTAAPPVCIDEKATYEATVETDVGTFVITLRAPASPAAVNNFVFLARYHYYDGTTFFRVIPDNILQGGSATNTNTGTPGYSFTGNTPASSCSAKSDCYPIGSVATANTGTPTTDGSQFFIVAGAQGEDYPPDYTLFGTVTSGMSVVDKIAADGNASTAANGSPPKVTHHIVKVTITELGA